MINSGTAVTLAALPVNLLYLPDKLLVFHFSLTLWSADPGIVAAQGYFQRLAETLQAVLSSVLPDKLVPYRERLLKIPTAFFRISTVSFRR